MLSCMSQEFVVISTIKIVIHKPSYSKVQKPAIIQFYLLHQTEFIFDRIKGITICIRRIYSFQEACALPTHLRYIDIEPKTQQLNRCHHTNTLANRTIIYISRLKWAINDLTTDTFLEGLRAVPNT